MLVAAGAVLAGHTGNSAAQIDWSSAQRVDLEMLDYEFVPKEVRLRRAVPYRLHLVNAGGDAHDFTAADFFASVELKDAAAHNGRRTSVSSSPGTRRTSISSHERPRRLQRAARITIGRE
jgi:hypothetical protein